MDLLSLFFILPIFSLFILHLSNNVIPLGAIGSFNLPGITIIFVIIVFIILGILGLAKLIKKM